MSLAPFMGRNTAVLSLQNGVDNTDKIARLWGGNRSLAGDRFLDLGGDSLRATQILGRTLKSFGIELSVGDVIQTETIAQMAELITIRNASGSGDPS